jgi:hypothetical protein
MKQSGAEIALYGKVSVCSYGGGVGNIHGAGEAETIILTCSSYPIDHWLYDGDTC